MRFAVARRARFSSAVLGAALNLHVRESYLDVHYRSRHDMLIRFSNELVTRTEPGVAAKCIDEPADNERRIEATVVENRSHQ